MSSEADGWITVYPDVNPEGVVEEEQGERWTEPTVVDAAEDLRGHRCQDTRYDQLIRLLDKVRNEKLEIADGFFRGERYVVTDMEILSRMDVLTLGQIVYRRVVAAPARQYLRLDRIEDRIRRRLEGM